MQSHKNNTLLLSTLIICILSFQILLAQKVVKFDDPATNLDKRWEQALNKVDEDPVWIGYSIQRLMGERSYIGRSDDFETGPSLQDIISGKSDIQSMNEAAEKERHFYWNDEESIEKELKDVGILIQVDKNKRIKKVDLSNLSLPFKLNGHSLFWLGGAKNDESISLLKNIFENINESKIKEDAITAVGIHENSSVGFDLLKDVIFSKEDSDVRESAVFWIAQHDNPEVLDLMKKIATEDESEDVREKAIFGLYVIDSDEATEAIIELARNSKWMDIRKQAVFWLGQTASKKAVDVLTDAVYDDEETEIQNQAVFALSQLKTDESIPSLIKVAKTHPNPEVRKKAIFWLGQTEDDRALDAIISFLKD